MDKKIAGLLGAAAALTTVNGAQAAAQAPTALEPAATYRDLLEPIPSALALLKNEDTKATDTGANGQTRLAQHLTIITIAIIGGTITIIIIDTITTIITITTGIRKSRAKDSLLLMPLLFFFRFRGAKKMAVGAVEDCVGAR